MDQQILFAILLICFLSLVLLIPAIFHKKNGEAQKDRIRLRGGESAILQKGEYRVEIKVKEIEERQIILEYLRLHKIYLQNTLFYEVNDLIVKSYSDGFLFIRDALKEKPKWDMSLIGWIERKSVRFSLAWVNRVET